MSNTDMGRASRRALSDEAFWKRQNDKMDEYWKKAYDNHVLEEDEVDEAEETKSNQNNDHLIEENKRLRKALEEIILQQEGSASWETADDIRDSMLAIARKALELTK